MHLVSYVLSMHLPAAVFNLHNGDYRFRRIRPTWVLEKIIMLLKNCIAYPINCIFSRKLNLAC